MAAMCGSTLEIEVQQISPLAVSQSLLVPHTFGQSEEGRQNGWS
jgi:hypothetical protein